MKFQVVAIILFIFSFSCKESPPGPPPPTVPDTTSHTISWQTDSTGYYFSRLLDVWGTSPTNVYAVGDVSGPPPELGKYIAHYDGVAWTAMHDDSLSWWIASGLLAAIHGISDTAIFVAGSRDNGYGVTGFVGHWNGRKWSNISPDSCSSLITVWAKSATDLYAAGDTGTVLHYDGNHWQRLQCGTGLDIWQITGLPKGALYGVASDYFNSFAGSVIVRIEGTAVIQDQVFPVGQKFGVWGTTNGEGYATGEGAFHKLNGSTWEEILTPNPRVVLWSVSGTASNNVIISGAFGAVIHWSGRTWKFYDELYDRSSSKSYFKDFAIGNKYFLVGNTPSHALITIGTRSNP
jgi:hypothetical protein